MLHKQQPKSLDALEHVVESVLGAGDPGHPERVLTYVCVTTFEPILTDFPRRRMSQALWVTDLPYVQHGLTREQALMPCQIWTGENLASSGILT